MNSTKKILIRGAGFQNKGAEAMLRVAQRELSKRILNANFYATLMPFEIPFAYRSGIMPLVYSPGNRLKLVRSIRLTSKAYDIYLSSKNPKYRKAIKTSQRSAYEINKIGDIDAVVDVSGFSYSDTLGPSESRHAYAWIEYCKNYKKPYIFLPQAWGPFEEKETAFWARRMCQLADLVVSRDDESAKHLAKLQGINISNVRVAPDIGLLFQGHSKTAGSAILKNLGYNRDNRPLIAIAPNMRVYERIVGTGSANLYVKLLITLANFCIESLGATIFLVPNEIAVPGGTYRDDCFLCGLVETCIDKTEYCIVLKEYLSSESIKSIISHVDLLIASRFHSLVFALSQSIPVVALGWSHKYRELLRPFGLEDHVIDHDRLDTNTVVSLVEKAWQQRRLTTTLINNSIPKMQNEINALFDEVATIIKND